MIRLLTGRDMPIVTAYLERNYLEMAVIRGNLAKCGIDNDKLSRRAGDYYGYFAAGKLRGMLVFYHLGSVMPHFETTAAIDEFAQLLRQRRVEVMVGLKGIVEPLCRALTADKHILDCEESYYLVNAGVKPYSLTCLHQIVPVEAVDREVALWFLVEAYRLGFKRRFSREMAIKLIEDRMPEEALLFLLVNNVPVAQAMIQVAAGRVSQIGGVYTRERSRGNGYCKALVAAVCRQIEDSGRLPALLVRRDNQPAVRAYQAVGFSRYAEYVVVKFGV